MVSGIFELKETNNLDALENGKRYFVLQKLSKFCVVVSVFRYIFHELIVSVYYLRFCVGILLRSFRSDVFLSYVTHMMLQLFGKHWQRLMSKGCFNQMELF